MIVSLLLALLAAIGGHPMSTSDVSGGPVSVASHSQPVAVSGRVSGGMHTSDVSGGPVSIANP
jgi:hypothetical protein